MTRLFVVRHGRPEIARGVAPSQWPLASDQREQLRGLGSFLELGPGALVAASTERKAIETAEALALSDAPVVSSNFREVQKPWFDEPADHLAAAKRYLAGELLSDWESRTEAIARFQEGVAEHRERDDVVIVTHGMVMAAWIASVTEVPDPFRFWAELMMPDVWQVDLAASRSWRLRSSCL